MQVYVINLARRQDRLNYITSELNRVGVEFTRLDAVDGAVSKEIGSSKKRLPNREGYVISDASAACSLSHMKAWQALLESEQSHCAILEDDVVLSNDFAACLSPDWLPEGTDVVRLETFKTRVHLSRHQSGALGARGVHRMLTRHVGAAAYIISRQAAESLLEYMTPLRDAADEVMFNEKYGWLPQANVYQVSPAMAMQADRMDDANIQDKSFAAGSIAMRKAAGDSAFYEPFGSRVSRRLYNEILARKRRSAYCIVPFKSNAD